MRIGYRENIKGTHKERNKENVYVCAWVRARVSECVRAPVKHAN